MSQVLLFGGAQAVAVVPVASPRKSSPRSKNKQSFQNKLWATFTSSDVKYKSPHSENRYNIQCMSVQHASKSKVVVNPLALEDAKEPPIHLYKPKKPYTATIVSVERIVGLKAPGETCHIVIDHGGNVPYWEGQSYGIIPPGLGLLLSVATSAACLWKPSPPTISVALLGYSLGWQILIAFYMMTSSLVTSTTILTISGFWALPPNSLCVLCYKDKIEEYSDEIFKLLDEGAHIYFCGLKGMMPGIQETLKRVAEQRGESWDEKLSQLKKNKQWHVEVY